MEGRVDIEIKPPTKKLHAHWMEVDFWGAIVSGHSPEEAAKELDGNNMFTSKDDKWKRGKEIRIISYNVISELGKVNY